MYSAIKSVTPHFTLLHAEDHSPIKRVTVCTQDNKELGENDIVRAIEHEDNYVTLSEKELERHAAIERDIVVRQFSKIEAIDPIYYEKPYYLVPSSGGELAYTILRQAFIKTGKAAIVTLIFYDRERLGLLLAKDGILLLHTLRFSEEIIPRSSIRTPALPQPSPTQIDLATRLVERYTSSFHSEDYRNQQLDLLHEIIERKAKGLPPKRTPEVSQGITPESEVTARMKVLLEDLPKSLDTSIK
jgi:DNA end-binding protein Ku